MKQDMYLSMRLERKCRLDTSVCNDKQHRNSDKCRCECKKDY